MRTRQVGTIGLLLLLGCNTRSFGDSEANSHDADSRRGAAGAEPRAETHAESLGPLEAASERALREFAGGHGEPLPEYAAKCDIATGIHVPDFNCSGGTLVPTTNATGTYPSMSCDRPNRLNRQCDPGSLFRIVAQSPDAVAVAHCRKKGLTGNNFGDIAVIQYNKKNGATCFYQALGTMDGNFKAPSLGTSRADMADLPNPAAAPWYGSLETHAINCAGCHDNGAIVRSPYLAQLSILPGAGDITYNSVQPVSFIGTDFQDWHTHSVKVTGNACNTCHRLGVPGHTANSFNNGGSARDFALRATARSISDPLHTATAELQKNPHSMVSPLWMPPNTFAYNQSNESQAQLIANCATAWKTGAALPSGCSVTNLSTTWTGISPASASVILAGSFL